MRIGLIAKTLGAQLLLALSLSALSLSAALAKPCVVPPVSTEAINQFKANPDAIVAPNSDTRTIEATVRDLVGTDAELAADMIHLAQGTNSRFRTAIAAGLAQAAVACTNLDQHAALLIEQAVAGFEDGDFQASFAAVSGDLSTAAAEAAAASAASSVGSVIIVNPNPSQPLATLPGGGGTPLAAITPVAITATTAPTTPITPSTSTTAANPVSATR